MSFIIDMFLVITALCFWAKMLLAKNNDTDKDELYRPITLREGAEFFIKTGIVGQSYKDIKDILGEPKIVHDDDNNHRDGNVSRTWFENGFFVFITFDKNDLCLDMAVSYTYHTNN